MNRINKYCRYCANCEARKDGSGYCKVTGKVLPRERLIASRRCYSYVESYKGDIFTGKRYQPRRKPIYTEEFPLFEVNE